ncbi:MAG: hypothetical protein DMG59_15065 [Acidobacteria bacterium]|nr:MAG: hypothetical protein DMG59_15065 [Acidobacteriota bacterium]
MRFLVLVLASAAWAAAESHPSWWSYASPEATALVGIQWENLRQSVFSEAVGAELSSAGSLGFPDLACLKGSTQILISSPPVLAVVTGTFPPATLRAQATGKALKPVNYRGLDLWISPGKTTLSVAYIGEQILLVGMRKTLEDAIDRSLAESGRRYSPLLARAARLSGGKDLWVVAAQLPDPLASLFVPIDVEASSFEGSVSVRDGLQLEATLDAASQEAAAAVAEDLRQSTPLLPAIARTLEITVEDKKVLLALAVNRQQLSANLRTAEAPQRAAAPKPAQESRIIRILGLDEGPREIILPPPK